MKKAQGYTRAASYADVSVIARDMREADVAEVAALSGHTPEEALTKALSQPGSNTMTICLPNGLPAGMYGVVPTGEPRVGLVWMLAANSIRVIHRQFLRECRGAIRDVCQDYDLIFNFTDARNSVHHRWIKWAGFTVIRRHEQFGVGMIPFYEFTQIMEKQHV